MPNPSSLTFHLIFKARNPLYLANQNKLNILLLCIPGYIEVDGNEIVDSLAKSASVDGQVLDFPLAHTAVWASTFLLHYDSAISKWLRVTENRNVGRYYFENLFKSCKIYEPWFSKVDLCRNFIVTRLRANYYSPATSLARENFIESDECPHYGFSGEDINHVLWASPNFSDSRRVLEASLIKIKCFPPHSIETFLYNPVSKPVSYI